MTTPLPTRRTVTFKANRDTLILLGCAVAVVLALSHGVHRQTEATAPQPAQQGWVGRLAEVSPDGALPAAAEPMSSDSLVVPKSALALPPVPAAARAPAKAQPCETQPCAAKAGVPLPPTRQKLATGEKPLPPAAVQQPAPLAPPSAVAPARARQGFAFSDLNPLPHLPDAVRRPFSYAGTRIAGWVDRF